MTADGILTVHPIEIFYAREQQKSRQESSVVRRSPTWITPSRSCQRAENRLQKPEHLVAGPHVYGARSSPPSSRRPAADAAKHLDQDGQHQSLAAVGDFPGGAPQ